LTLGAALVLFFGGRVFRIFISNGWPQWADHQRESETSWC